MSVKKVIISDYYDGFSVDVFFEDGTKVKFDFDQENNRKELVDVFENLGVKEVRYQEVY